MSEPSDWAREMAMHTKCAARHDCVCFDVDGIALALDAARAEGREEAAKVADRFEDERDAAREALREAIEAIESGTAHIVGPFHLARWREAAGGAE